MFTQFPLSCGNFSFVKLIICKSFLEKIYSWFYLVETTYVDVIFENNSCMTIDVVGSKTNVFIEPENVFLYREIVIQEVIKFLPERCNKFTVSKKMT